MELCKRQDTVYINQYKLKQTLKVQTLYEDIFDSDVVYSIYLYDYACRDRQLKYNKRASAWIHTRIDVSSGIIDLSKDKCIQILKSNYAYYSHSLGMYCFQRKEDCINAIDDIYSTLLPIQT